MTLCKIGLLAAQPPTHPLAISVWLRLTAFPQQAPNYCFHCQCSACVGEERQQPQLLQGTQRVKAKVVLKPTRPPQNNTVSGYPEGSPSHQVVGWMRERMNARLAFVCFALIAHQHHIQPSVLYLS